MAPPGIGRSVEGHHAVAAAVAAGRVVRLLVELRRADGYADLIAAARASGAEVKIVDDVRPMADTTSPQGLVARCRPIPAASLDDAVAAASPAAVLVLDHIEDPRNVGAIARSALAAGVNAMISSGWRSAPLEGTAFKAAAGALEHMAIVEVSSIPAVLGDLRSRGLWIVGLDGGGDQSLFGLGLLTEPVALVVGAEGAGLSRLVADRCDVLARIPISDRIESLNASVAAGLAVFEVARARAS
ncbi:MAG: 23S rRNA (guanosine(2251)-2'-O)-methyltransferase RlmB [Actinobacteria bacterium]|nr:23S rRNA (guanosine(2251)-2'-O)-methyltransferase RlmB [Actinomycetota bacterium]MBU1492808.1 23S rRNA (guanosine(2251)-2'-O)-methyltransferase RlmB [Actinomycetota bacterium]